MSWAVWAAVAGAVAMSYCFALLAMRIAPAVGLVDRPDGDRKLHGKATPLMGGMAIYLALLVSMAFIHFFDTVWSSDASQPRFRLVMLLISGGLFCILGLVDDKWEMRPRNKFVWQIAACLPFAVWGRSVDTIDFLGLHIHLGGWGTLFTVFWLVAFSNIINLIDGLDGLASAVGLVVLLTIAALAGICGQPGVAILSLLVAGSVGGFLIHNWPPARIFMGDSGSLTVGFLIGALSIESWLKQAAGFTLIVPLVLVSIPMFDTVMAIIRRKLAGRSVGHADREHIHHRLQDRGFTPLQVLLTLAGLSSVMALVAIASVVFHSDLLAVGLCVTILGLLIVGRVFGHHEVQMLSQQLRAMTGQMGDLHRHLASRRMATRLASVQAGQRQTRGEIVHRQSASLDLGCQDSFALASGEFMNVRSHELEQESEDYYVLHYVIRRDADSRAAFLARGLPDLRSETASSGDLMRWLAKSSELS